MTDHSRHILGTFESAISTLNSGVHRMSALAQDGLENARRGLIGRDAAMCDAAIAGKDEVDDLEREISLESEELIMKFGPVAADLRKVIATLKVATAVKCVSDHIVRFSRQAQQINQQPPVPETFEMQPLCTLAVRMLRDAVVSFCEEDLEKALVIGGRDSRLDTEYWEFNRRLVSRMQEDAAHIPLYIDLLFCARSLERIGDQSVRIAENAIYVITALDVRPGALVS